MIGIPKGFAHGFYTLSEADVLYKATDFYAPQCERTLLWNDPREPIVSENDRTGIFFKEATQQL